MTTRTYIVSGSRAGFSAIITEKSTTGTFAIATPAIVKEGGASPQNEDNFAKPFVIHMA